MSWPTMIIEFIKNPLVLICMITFLARYIPRLICPKAISSDSYYHMLRADNIRNNSFKFLKEHPQLTLFGEDYYPVVYHYILALFPRSARYKVEQLSGAVFDMGIVILFYWIASQYLPIQEWNYGRVVLLGLIVGLHPAYVSLSYGPRAYSGSARVLGELLCMTALVAMWWSWEGNNGLIGVMIAILAGVATLMTSIFASQALAFLTILMAFMLNNLYLLLVLPITVVVTIALTNGFYWKVLSQKFNLFINYARSVVNINSYHISLKEDAKSEDIKKRLIHFLYKSPIGIFITRHNLLIGLFILYIISYLQGFHIRANDYLMVWLASALIIFAITSTRPFLFLGEAERYLEYAVIPAVLILVQVIVSLFEGHIDLVLWIIILCICVPWYLSQVVALILWSRKLPGGRDYEGLVNKIREISPATVLTILNDAPWRLAYYTKHKYVWMWPQLNFKNNKKALEEFYSIYPWPHADLRRYFRNYGVSIIPVEKSVVKRMAGQGIQYDFSGFRNIYENSRYVLYQLHTFIDAD